MTRALVARSSFVIAICAALWTCSCAGPLIPEYSYYEDQIQPVVQLGCAMQTTGCHLASPEGTAAGNLDLASYDSLMRRADLLAPYGPYPVGVLLLKGAGPVEINVETIDGVVPITTDIRHSAGAGIAIDSRGYAKLQQWIRAGHTRTGIPPTRVYENSGVCTSSVGTFPGFDASVDPADAAGFAEFVANVQPMLTSRCAGGSCHGTRIANLFLACGGTPEERRWNYFIAVQHLGTSASSSELMRRPLAPLRGGSFHEGGTIFESEEEADYVTMRTWAEGTLARNPDIARAAEVTEGLRFFSNRVQPVLVRKGCMFPNCHSTAMFHDLRLHGGSQGAFSSVATRRNYEMSRLLLALESDDPNQSRLVAKNLYTREAVEDGDGIAHRGGALLEDFGSTSTGLQRATVGECDGVDADAGDLNEIPGYCVLARWHELERSLAIERGEVLPRERPVSAVVWVARPPSVGTPADFDTYRPGADLLSADATFDADGGVALGAPRSLLAACGLDSSTADVRGPATSWDAQRIAFSARSSSAEALHIYEMNSDGTACARLADLAMATEVDADTGILLHDFDPAYSADGRMVFASTRGNLDCDGLDSCGPTRTPASLQPNSNLYVYDPGATPRVRQLTFLLNHEFQPSFMLDGRAIFTSEKREPEFHQFATRRINLDGGDYHPLFAQRNSVGFEVATEVLELPNRNFAVVGSTLDATNGAGAIVFLNRSIGPDQTDRDPTDRFYIASTRTPVPGALRGGTGSFRSPAPLPTGRILVSCDLVANTLTQSENDFDLCELDPRNDSLRHVAGTVGSADVEAVVVMARAPHSVFASRADEANGHTVVDSSARDAVVRVHDFPMIATLLFSNTRIGRPINRNIRGFDAFAAMPPPASVSMLLAGAPNIVTDSFGSMYVNDRLLGHIDLFDDGSTVFRFRGGTPLRLRPTDENRQPILFGGDGPFTGEAIQREQMQFYPGERSTQSLPRRFFNGLCGGCHGSITGRELDVAVNIDVLTSASRTSAREATPIDLP